MSPNEVIIKLKNAFLTDNLFVHTIEQLALTENYEKTLDYKSNIDDCLVFQLKYKSNPITLTRYGENELLIKIKGRKEDIKIFLFDFIAEVATIMTNTILNSFVNPEKVTPAFINELRENIRKTIKTTVQKIE